MSWVIDENPNTILLIVGDGPERAELENWVRHLELEKNVIFTGAVPPEDVHTYYQIADVFVSASTSETQGLVYIEAAANGLPLICHRDPCLQGIIDEHENGFCYETLEEIEKAFMHCLRVKNLADARFFTQELVPRGGPSSAGSFAVFACAKTPQGAALASGMSERENEFRKTASMISRKNALKYSKQQFANQVEYVYYSLLPREGKYMLHKERMI